MYSVVLKYTTMIITCVNSSV